MRSFQGCFFQYLMLGKLARNDPHYTTILADYLTQGRVGFKPEQGPIAEFPLVGRFALPEHLGLSYATEDPAIIFPGDVLEPAHVGLCNLSHDWLPVVLVLSQASPSLGFPYWAISPLGHSGLHFRQLTLPPYAQSPAISNQ